MRHRHRPATGLRLSLLALVQSIALSTFAADAKSPTLTPCSLPGLAQPARCGMFEVPENPARPDGRRLSIGVAVIPASGGKALPDPIVPLMGGPGEDAISAAAIFAGQLASLRSDRDILLVDQRGTGRSNALGCKLYSTDDSATNLRDVFPGAAVARCRQQLSERADLTQYTYVHFAHDLEHIRRALGYGAMNLSGGSYGTRAAVVFLQTYPQSVRTVYLGSVVPIDVPTPLAMARNSQIQFESTLNACEADAACRKAFPNLRKEFGEVIARLDAGEVRITLPGRADPVSVPRGRVMERFRSLLYRPADAAMLPWMIHRAYTGDWNPIAQEILAGAREADTALSFGVFFSITCNDDVAFVREEDVAPATRDTYLGDYRLRQQLAACKGWPKALLPPNYRKPARSSVPAMFVSGDADAASPLAWTARVASGFSERAEVVLVGRGHTEWSACLAPLYEQLVRTGRARGIDPSSCKPAARPPFKVTD
jgi:pimeloyl-ACP methyl ester carboxylesterase